MGIALWIVSGLVAAAYLAAGTLKAFAYEKYVETAAWAKDVSPALVRTIGVLELAGAVGIILPWLTGIAPALTILAAAGLVLIQVGAIPLHVRRKEFSALPVNVVLLVLPLFVFLGRLLWS